MSGFLMHVGAIVFCPHFGMLKITSQNNRVRVSGQPVGMFGDEYAIKTCGFTVPPGKPQPCESIRWQKPSARIKVNGQPVVLSESAGMCLTVETIPQGPPIIVFQQFRVKGL